MPYRPPCFISVLSLLVVSLRWLQTPLGKGLWVGKDTNVLRGPPDSRSRASSARCQLCGSVPGGPTPRPGAGELCITSQCLGPDSQKVPPAPGLVRSSKLYFHPGFDWAAAGCQVFFLLDRVCSFRQMQKCISRGHTEQVSPRQVGVSRRVGGVYPLQRGGRRLFACSSYCLFGDKRTWKAATQGSVAPGCFSHTL